MLFSDFSPHLQWFYSLDLFIDLPELRAVHACWDDDHIDWLTKGNFHKMTKELLIRSHNKNDEAYTVIDDILKGKEFSIPEQHAV